MSTDALCDNQVLRRREDVIDTDADPFVPENWGIEEHRKGGQFVWDPTKVGFYLSKKQESGEYIEGHVLRNELADKVVTNANVLDYLLKNPRLIPEEWKKDEKGNTRYIFFWGTVYRNAGCDLCVRCIYWDGGGWQWEHGLLDRDWRGSRPSVVLSS